MSNKSRSDIEFSIDIVVEPDGDSFHAYCPALKGLHTCGDTEEEALNNAVQAATAYLRSLIKHGDSIPIGIVHQEEVRKAIPLCRGRYVHSHTRDLVVAGR